MGIDVAQADLQACLARLKGEIQRQAQLGDLDAGQLAARQAQIHGPVPLAAERAAQANIERPLDQAWLSRRPVHQPRDLDARQVDGKPASLQRLHVETYLAAHQSVAQCPGQVV